MKENSSKITPADEKRLKSLSNKRSLYNEQKSLIRNALANIDTVVGKKIKFDDDDEAVPVTPSSKIKETSFDTSNGHKKASLFDNDSDDDADINFDIKEQYEGEAGQKLMKLQSTYKNDKRFVLDERFIDDDDPGKDNNETEVVDTPDDDEKQKQLEILEGILGTQVRPFKKSLKNEDSKKPPVKTMLRFDPSKPDHSKYISAPVQKEVVKKKKQKRDIETEAAVPEPPKNVAPEVSKERFYKIDETLAKSLGNSDEQPFSLLNLYGKKDDDDENKDEEYEPKPFATTKTKNPLDDKNAFKYDSSDTEDEKDTENQSKNETTTETSLPTQSASILSTENFFFAKDDSRFKESIDFWTSSKVNNEHSHLDFKKAINKRMQNMKSGRNQSKNNRLNQANQKLTNGKSSQKKFISNKSKSNR